LAVVTIQLKDEDAGGIASISLKQNWNPKPQQGVPLTPAQETAQALLLLLEESCKRHQLAVGEEQASSMNIPEFRG